MVNRLELLDDPQEAIRLAIEDVQSTMWMALPAYITEVNLEAQTISAQPTIRGEVTDVQGNISQVDLPLLVNVPICFPRGGGYAITFPLQVNDEVLIVFASRCIDGWWQSGGIQTAPEFRMHDLSDGFAVLAPTSQPFRLDNVSDNSLQIRNLDGTKYIEISEEMITVQSNSDVNVTAENITANASDSVTITGTSSVNINSDTSINLTAPDIYLNGVVHP